MSRNLWLNTIATSLMTAVLSISATGTAAAEPGAIALSVKRHAAATEASQPARPRMSAPLPARKTSAWKKVAAGIIGGVGGFFAGGYLGAKIEGGGCACDDPGLKGAIIGAPIGAAVGATLGVVLAR